MKVNDMAALIGELIDILNHNEVMYKKAKSLGYIGFYPDYADWQRHLEETKNRLVTFNGENLSSKNVEKLEKACENFCLTHLVHGSKNDELYLCKLTEVSPRDIFSNMEDKTSDLATKYGLKIESLHSEFYLNKFSTLFNELTIAVSNSEEMESKFSCTIL